MADTVTVQVMDSLGAISQDVFTIPLPATSTLVISPSSGIPDAAQGIPYEVLFSSTGTGPWSWSLINNPSWMTINASTGLLSGTPTASGSFAVTVNVTDSLSATGSLAI